MPMISPRRAVNETSWKPRPDSPSTTIAGSSFSVAVTFGGKDDSS
jgi:hypothetical protein